jgi:predicted alpha/beta-hydrolase family hydrolase
MVRYYWHVDDGCSAHVPVNGVTLEGSEPTRLAVEMDVPGVAGSAGGLLSMPPCTAEGKTPTLRKTGIVIAHDVDAASWQGPLLTSMAQVCFVLGYCSLGASGESATPTPDMQCLAKKGFIVMRNFCNLKELRRLRMFEKALDTVSKSPYATFGGVESWLLVGMGNGARVAATVSSKAKTNIAGLAVISYPLHECTPPAGKGAGFPDSTSQLSKCSVPLMVLQGELDARCSAASMSAFLRRIRPLQPGPRFGIVPAVNENLLGSDDAVLNARTVVCPLRRFCAVHWPVQFGGAACTAAHFQSISLQ